MPKFDKRFVHFMWDDELEGKEVFYADDIYVLKLDVENNKDKNFAIFSEDESAPFMVKGGDFIQDATWRFVYYDPYFQFKLAREQGKVIQKYWISKQEWEEYIGDDFIDDISWYRIKPEEKPVTNRELARWLSKGNGEYKTYEDGDLSPYNQYYYYYKDCEADDPVKIHYVRKWEDPHWHEPTREYMGLED